MHFLTIHVISCTLEIILSNQGKAAVCGVLKKNSIKEIPKLQYRYTAVSQHRKPVIII